MKTLYTTILAVFVALTASAQFISEDFSKTPPYNYDFNLFGDTKTSIGNFVFITNNGTSTTIPSGNSWSRTLDAGNYYLAVDPGNNARGLRINVTVAEFQGEEKTVNGLKERRIAVSWRERLIGGKSISVSITCSYFLNGVNVTTVVYPTTTQISTTWNEKSVLLPAAVNGATFQLSWNLSRTPGNTDKYAIDDIKLFGELIPLAPQPVELASFQGQVLRGSTKLNWTTASEKNNDRFLIERSPDGKNFSQIGEVKGSGNSSTRLNYSFTDSAPLAGTNYYRLRQVDFDGTESFSSVVALEVAPNGFETTVYPTVASQVITISLQNLSGSALIRITDVSGRTVATFTTVTHLVELPVTNLKTGVYLVQVTDSQSHQTKRFIKQ